jgi:BirA family biotin operon repressor/biotin-[acetyl-CoA-carboxylase] ligase
MPHSPPPDHPLHESGFATVELHPSIGSTMERAREIAGDGVAPLPAVVLADVQTAGRGRQGARWWQPPGALAASLVIDETSATAAVHPTWSLACGVTLAETIEDLEPAVAPLVKWPNDLEVAGRKLAGILLETDAAGNAILGIGVNTTGSAVDAPPPLRHRLTTLPDLTGRDLRRELLLGAFLRRFLDLVRGMQTRPQLLVERYAPRCSLVDRAVKVFRGAETISGICRGIAADGSLVVDTATGRRWLTSGSLTDPADAWPGP